MDEIKFSWDARKSRQNIKKHKVSFEEAATVFFDEKARLIHDPDHSEHEERFVLLGLSSRLRLLAVCHCYRRKEQVVRIISARRANNREKNQYGRFL